MENIFENAYFGKPYKTRNGKKAIFWKSMNSNNTDIALLCEDFCISVNPNGIIDDVCFGDTFPNKHDYDIVSEWQEEEIDEDELNEIATLSYKNSFIGEVTETEIYRRGFKAGYRKAKEE